MPTPTLRGLNNTPDSDTLYAVTDKSFPSVATIGAGVANTTVQSYLVMPFNYKIRKVAVALTAIDAVAGLDSFNIVVGGLTGQTGQTYTQNNAAPNDNSQSGSVPPGTGGMGYATNIAVAGQTVFANDVPFTATNVLPNPSAANTAGFGGLTGYGMTNTGWVTLATTGGYGIFVPTNYDAVYSCTTPLSLRVTTVASTGAISNLSVILGIVFMPLRKGPAPGQSIYGLPGVDY